MSKTFRVASYDADGRRMLPTVLKIGSRALIGREEQANRKYVERPVGPIIEILVLVTISMGRSC